MCRATVILSDVWYKDDGALTKVLCARQSDEGNIETVETADSPANVDCCACGTAKYQLTFHSLRSRLHHLADVDTSLLHWSPVIGSSHSKHYVMWRFDTLASQGVSNICQFGDTRTLEDEIRHKVWYVDTVCNGCFNNWNLFVLPKSCEICHYVVSSLWRSLFHTNDVYTSVH